MNGDLLARWIRLPSAATSQTPSRKADPITQIRSRQASLVRQLPAERLFDILDLAREAALRALAVVDRDMRDHALGLRAHVPVTLQDERHDLGVVAFDGRLHGAELVLEPRLVDDVDDRGDVLAQGVADADGGD